MAFIDIKNLYKRYKKVVAVNRINLEVNQGEMLTLLGPSGCGKTTTLRSIAGLERPEDGDIVIDGKSMLAKGFVQPSKRGVGMVFQNYAVWPHMKVYNNIVYGLKLMKLPKAEIRKKALDVLELVGLGGLEDRYPAQLSGGQQQRVALARALVRNPKVLLLDEPLSNLDAKLREKMRFEIKSLVRRMGITSVYVTHDQAEAMVISDRVVVMNQGNVIQIGPPHEIYEKPADTFVADFIGAMNFMPGVVLEKIKDRAEVHIKTSFSDKMLCQVSDRVEADPGLEVQAAIRPEDVEVLTDPDPNLVNLYQGKIAHQAYLGNFLYLFVTINGNNMIRVQAPHNIIREEGQEIYLYMNPEKCIILP